MLIVGGGEVKARACILQTVIANDVGHNETKWHILDMSIYDVSNRVMVSISAKTEFGLLESCL